MAMELELISPFDVAKDAVLAIQEYARLAGQSVTNFFRRPVYWGDILQQADLIGVGSLPIVVLSGLSIGALLALNSASTLERFGGITLIGQLVSSSSKKLVTPRVAATVFMLFFLTIISDLLGLFGGFAVANLLFGLDSRQYWSNAWQTLVFRDVFMGLVKPVLFGFIIASIGCYYGMSTRGGTQGVGRSTTQAVVTSSVLILVVDFFVTKLIFALLGYR